MPVYTFLCLFTAYTFYACFHLLCLFIPFLPVYTFLPVFTFLCQFMSFYACAYLFISFYTCLYPFMPVYTCLATTASCGSSGSAEDKRDCKDSSTVLSVIAAALKQLYIVRIVVLFLASLLLP